MVLGLVELHTHDLEGNLLGIEYAKNIMFDDARVSMLLNPCIIDRPNFFKIYFSEFKEKVNSSYYYWDSSVLSRYLTTNLTLTGPDYLDSYTRMYTFTSPASLPGSTVRTLRVLGILEYNTETTTISDSYFKRYSTAVTLNTPVIHDTTTYVTVYYKLILGINKESALYGNIYNWYNRTYQTVATNLTTKGYYSDGCYPLTINRDYSHKYNGYGGFNLINTLSAEYNVNLTARNQSGYLPININGACMFGSRVKDGMSCIPLGGKKDYSKSRTFLHSAGSTCFYGDLTEATPLTKGSITLNYIDGLLYPTVYCINILDSGEVGRSSYNVSIHPASINKNSKGRNTVTNMLQSISTSDVTLYSWNSYFSENRNWGVIYNTNSYIYVYYKGVTSAFKSGSFIQGNGVITNSGTLYYSYTSNPTSLFKNDRTRIYDISYTEETINIPSKINNYTIDDSDNSVVLLCRNDESDVTYNSHFSTNIDGWNAGPNTSIYNGGTYGVGSSLYMSPGYFYQDVPLIIGRAYNVTVTCSYNNTNWRIELDNTAVTTQGTSTKTCTFKAAAPSVRFKVVNTSNSYYYFDLAKITLQEEGSIIRVAPNNNVTTYNQKNTSVLSTLNRLSLAFTPNSRWYWRANKGKIVWYANNTIHYWDYVNQVNTFSTTSNIFDICVTDDFNKLCYVSLTGSSATWKVLELSESNCWRELYSVTRSIPTNTYNYMNAGYNSNYSTVMAYCFVDDVYMYQFSAAHNWGYRINLLDFSEEPWLINYPNDIFNKINQYAAYFLRCTGNMPNRSMIAGSLMHRFEYVDYLNSSSITSTSIQYLDIPELKYGWDGTKWVLGHAGKKKTHYDAQPLPIAGTVAFGKEGENTENYVAGEYFTVGINPAGYVFDNSMSTSMNAWVYAGVPQYKEETFLINPPVSGTISTVTLTAALHPDWLCVEDSGGYFTAVFDTGMTGNRVGSTSYLSYFGEYFVEPSTGVISFHSSCANHTVTLKYYWVRRDV